MKPQATNGASEMYETTSCAMCGIDTESNDIICDDCDLYCTETLEVEAYEDSLDSYAA